MDNILGEYSNDNFVVVNIFSDLCNETKTIDKTVLHEIMHMLLSLQTRWGCFEYSFNHINRLLDSSYSEIEKYVHSCCKDAQECVAEAWERLYIYKTSGLAAMINDIRETKYKNPKAYNYLEKIMPLLLQNKINVETTAFLIYKTALYSLNSPFETISSDIWFKKNIPADLIPNNIFWKKLEELKNLFEKDPVHYDRYLSSLNSDWDYTNKDDISDNLKRLTEYILYICSKSTYYNEIENYLATITPKEINLNNFDDYVCPQNYSHYNSGEIKNIRKMPLNKYILFIFGDVRDLLYTVSSKAFHNDIPFDDIDNKIIFGIYFNYFDKTAFPYAYSYIHFKKELHCISYPIVLSYKTYENNKPLVKELNDSHRQYFVYCDRPYATAKLTIENICKDKLYTICDYKRFYLICIKLSSYGLFLLPVIDCNSFINDCYNSFYSGTVMQNSFLDDNLQNQIDLIINCIFEL